MEFTINRDVFLKALGHANGIIEKKTTLPILSNILLEAKDSKIKITATDLDIIYFEQILPQELKTEGSTTTSASIIYDILRKLQPNAKVEINLLDKNKLLANVNKLMQEKIRLEEYINSCNRFFSFPSNANFLLCKFYDFTSNEIYDIFSKRGIFIRKFDNKMLENCIRISAGTSEQTDKVINILNEINNKK